MKKQAKLPRPFKMPWGKGMVTEEIQVYHQHYTPTIQFLEFERGEKALRFCVYHGRAFSRVPLIVNEETIVHISREVAKSPKIMTMLKKLVSN